MHRIGRYIVQGILGRGGMSIVYKVAMPITEKIVALKLLSPPEILVDMMGKEELRRLFVAEALTMAAIRHPAVADVWDFDEHQGWPFFVMEYFCNNLGVVIGEKAETEKRSRTLGPEKVFHYLAQVLDGLSCLHQAGIIHRDIKPFNILITDQDLVKIADFGLSTLHGESLPRTSRHIKVGSPFYAAPEQEEAPDRIDLRADLFSVGVMAFRLLTGGLPFVNPGLSEVAPLWRVFLRKALERDPKERFASAGVMLAELMRLKKRWEEERENTCMLVVTPHRSSGEAGKIRPIRSQQLKVSPRDACRAFGLDHLWRPAVYLPNDFQINNDESVFDHTTGLVWQQAGSDYPETWQQAHQYVEKLNQGRFAGQKNWRLPTVDELLTLLTEKGTLEDLCINPVFDRCQRWLWSIDRRSGVAAWYVSIDMGFLAWQDFTCHYYVRAVCSGKSESPG